MIIESQITSLELSRRLRELGMRQNSYFVWFKLKEKNDWFVSGDWEIEDDDRFDTISAFTVAELGEMLPFNIKDYELEILTTPGINNDKYKKYWRIRYISLLDNSNEKLYEAHEFNEADARARMLIHLIENNLVTSEWREQWLS